MAVTFAALSFVSCGGNKTSEPTTDADSAISDANADTDTQTANADADAAIQSLDKAIAASKSNPEMVKQSVASIQQKIAELKASGNTEAAQAYASKLQTYLKSHADDIKSIDPQSVTVVDVVNAVANAPQTVKNAAQSAVQAAESDVNAARSAATKAATAA